MSRQSRNVLIGIAIAAILAVIGLARWRVPRGADSARSAPGGVLVVSMRSEPRTFNRYVARDQGTEAIDALTQAKLVRINRITQDVEPWLAERWTRSDDGLTFTLTLRRGVTFSDGQPFTSEDVLFSFAAAYDEKTGGTVGDTLQLNGKKLQVTAPDARTVVITLPTAYAPGVRLLDNLPIFPRHKLEAAFKAGTFAKAWSLSTPPADIAGLGPFVMTEYVAGQRVVFARNPHYWRKDADGAPLPYLDGVVIEIVPEQDAELLRLEAGQSDLTLNELRPEDYAPIKRAADQGRLTLRDLGVSLDADAYWFNLKPGAFAADPRRAWLQRAEFRRAISMAVDRQRFADTVFLGAGVPVFGPVTPANRKWHVADALEPSYDVEGAKRLLSGIGLSERDGALRDASGRPVQFTLVTQKGATALEKGAAVVRDELKKIGMRVDVVTLDYAAVVQRFLTGDYEAVAFHLYATDTDPANNLDFWMSNGSAHIWNIAQATPATDWERRIDDLMRRQLATPDEAERQRLFADVQRIFAEQAPVLYFVAPRVYVATSSRVLNVAAAVQRPQVLWAADTLAVAGGSRTTH